jgi:hypothetical protein
MSPCASRSQQRETQAVRVSVTSGSLSAHHSRSAFVCRVGLQAIPLLEAAALEDRVFDDYTLFM